MNSFMQKHILFRACAESCSDSSFAYVPQVNYIGTRNFFDEWCKFNGVSVEKETCEYLMRKSTRVSEPYSKDAKTDITYIKLRRKPCKPHDIALKIRCNKIRESLDRRRK